MPRDRAPRIAARESKRSKTAPAMSGGGADVSTKSTTPQGTDGTKGTDDRRDHERRMRALCASTSAAMREAGADADARAIAGEAVGALFEPTLRPARPNEQKARG